jgi:hypothetical protein
LIRNGCGVLNWSQGCLLDGKLGTWPPNIDHISGQTTYSE